MYSINNNIIKSHIHTRLLFAPASRAARTLPLLWVLTRTVLGTLDNLEASIGLHFSKRTVLKSHNRARGRFFASGFVQFGTFFIGHGLAKGSSLSVCKRMPTHVL